MATLMAATAQQLGVRGARAGRQQAQVPRAAMGAVRAARRASAHLAARSTRSVTGQQPRTAIGSSCRAASRAAATRVVASGEAPVAIVTGGSRGLGLAIAKELGASGCKLVLNHVSNNGIEEAIAACKEAGATEVTSFQGTVSDKDTVDKLLAYAKDTYGSVDILVNNAGITRDTLVLRMKPAQWQEVIDVNLTGVFYCAQAASKIMMKQRSGRIINIASVVGQMGNVGQANYSAAKGGVIAMTKTFAREFASRGVCVNAVAPGFIKSDMTNAIDPKYEEMILGQIPLGRMGEPDEVAGLVRYLALDPSAAYMTGHCFNVDGGMAM